VTATGRARGPSSRNVSGLIVGGRGGPEDALLEDGQEEVFAREEVEAGRIEHHEGEESTDRTGRP
jgi:hypothetical protein